MNSLRNRNIDRTSFHAANTIGRIMVCALGWMVVPVMVMSVLRVVVMLVNPPSVLQ